jgi:hypothetical protein
MGVALSVECTFTSLWTARLKTAERSTCEELIGRLMILDRAPKGRNENRTMDFVRRHDEYDNAPELHDCLRLTKARN